MKKQLPILILVFLSIFSVNGQNIDWKLTVPPNSRNVYDAKYIGDGEVIVIGGSKSNDSISTISKTPDEGNYWDVLIDKPFSPALMDAHFITKDTVVFVGETGLVFRSIDGGENLVRITLPGSVTKRVLTSVYFLDKSHGFIVGGNRANDAITTILETKDGGLTWSIIKDGLGPMLLDIHFYDKNNGSCVGNNGLVMNTTDGGTTWNAIKLKGSIASRTFNTVYYVNSNLGFIGGGHPSNDSIQTMLKTIDGGSTWSTVSDKVNPMIQDISFHGEMNGLAVGNNGLVLRTKDGGGNWTNETLPGVNDNWYFTSVDYWNDSNIVIGGLGGALFIAYDSAVKNTSIKNVSKANKILFPNPAKEYFEITIPFSKVELINTLGETIETEKYSIGGRKVYLKDLSSGIYYVNITSLQGEIYNNKLIIE